MNTIYKCIQISENDEWVKGIKEAVTRLKEEDRRFADFKKVVIVGKNSRDILPVKFVQPTIHLFVFQRADFPIEAYAECIKMFAYCVHSYYVTHDNYVQLCNRIGTLQSQMSDAPTQIGIISDIMDTFYMCIMSGKYLDRNKTLSVSRTHFQAVADEIGAAYKMFPYNPFRAIGAACVDAVIKTFYKLDFKIPIPDYQSARLILNRVQELTREGVVSVGPTATYDFAHKFFHITSAFIHSMIDDIKISKTSASRTIRRKAK